MIYNPLDTFYKNKIGAICAKEELTFRVKGNFNSLSFVYFLDGQAQTNEIKMTKLDDHFSLTISFDRGLYFYCFKIDENHFVGLSNKRVGKILSYPNYFQLSVFDSDYKVPTTIKGGLIYQIFPDRFCRFNNQQNVAKTRFFHKDVNDLPVYLPAEDGEIYNNDFFGGDLLGIISKLDYLKDLGVTAIYLNPIFKAYSNHRYDTADYFSIDELLGSTADLKFLISESHKRNIKVILDGVFNHTGDDSIYFNKYNSFDSVGAYQSKDSPYYDWFDFKNYPNEYNCWWGIKTLPTTKKEKPFIDFIAGDKGVVSYYTKLGIDGWRLDVVDELPQNFVEEIRKTVKSINNDAIIIGEVWEDASNKIAYDKRRAYFLGKELDSVMNYPLKDAILDYANTGCSKELDCVIRAQIDHYPESVLNSLMNMLSTHDTIRILTALSNKNVEGLDIEELSKIVLDKDEYLTAFLKLKIATILQFTLYGTPSIYYGDEIGMQGYKDPLNRAYFKWDNVGNDIYKWYKKLSILRSSVPSLNSGVLSDLYSQDGLITYKKISENSQAFIVLNLGNKEYEFKFSGKLTNLLDGKVYENIISFKGDFYGIFVNLEENCWQKILVMLSFRYKPMR